MVQNKTPYDSEQIGKIDHIIDEVRNQNLYALVIREEANGKNSVLSSREYDNDEMIDALEGKNDRLGDRIIIATSRGPNSNEYDIVSNISVKKDDRSPDGIQASFAGYSNPDPKYDDQLANISTAMTESAPENRVQGPGM